MASHNLYLRVFVTWLKSLRGYSGPSMCFSTCSFIWLQLFDVYSQCVHDPVSQSFIQLLPSSHLFCLSLYDWTHYSSFISSLFLFHLWWQTFINVYLDKYFSETFSAWFHLISCLYHLLADIQTSASLHPDLFCPKFPRMVEFPRIWPIGEVFIAWLAGVWRLRSVLHSFASMALSQIRIGPRPFHAIPAIPAPPFVLNPRCGEC